MLSKLAIAAIGAAALSYLAQTSKAVNLVADPSFEDSGANGSLSDGWTNPVNNPFGNGPLLRDDTYQPWPIHSGAWVVAFGSPGPANGGSEDTISQDIATVIGTTYNVSFYLDNFGNGSYTPAGQGFSANFGSGSISTNASLSDYTLETFSTVATSTTTTLNLAGFDYLNSGYYTLDDVSVTAAAVPEPTSLSLLGLGVMPLLRRRRRLA